jgi:hypothetical protein
LTPASRYFSSKVSLEKELTVHISHTVLRSDNVRLLMSTMLSVILSAKVRLMLESN